MAPAILFTYIIWGTTQRHERSVDGEFIDFSKEKKSSVDDLIEAVYGLRFYQQPHLIDQIRSQLSYELYEAYSNNSETIPTESPAVNETEVLSQLAGLVRSGMLVYFHELRDSFRAIMNEIETYLDPNRLAVSKFFWRDLVLKCIQSQESENELWDLKETLEIFSIREAKAKLNASVKFVEKVAGFANSSGGVFIIGVSDNPRKLIGMPSEDIEDRSKHIGETIERHVNPKKDFYKIIQISVYDESVIKNCLIIVVAQTKDVLMVDDSTGRFSVPLRSTSGLIRLTPEEVAQRKRTIEVQNYNYIERLLEFIQSA